MANPLKGKLVYLPKFTVAMVRTPASKANPFLARFHVPLNFSKFDLRSYLQNLYNVEVRKIRSWVRQSPVTGTPKPIDRDGEVTVQRRRIRRPMSKKYMEVDLVKPFVWPEPPLRNIATGEKIERRPEQSIADVEDELREEQQRSAVERIEEKLEKVEDTVHIYKESDRAMASRQDLKALKNELAQAKNVATQALEKLAPLIQQSQKKDQKKLVEPDLSEWGGVMPGEEYKVQEVADKKQIYDKRKWAADQFKALKSGQTKWRPTWQELQR